MTDLPTGTVTFLFTDVEGSTRLVAALGDAYLRLHERHQQIVRAAIEAHQGREVSTEGDSFFVVFERAADAIGAAVAAQLALAAAEWPADAAVRVRMGIHTGQGIRGGDNYIGLDVHRAARVAASGHGGQVIVSETTRDAVGPDLPDDIELRDLGRHRLRDVGVEHLWQADVAGLPAQFGPLRSLEVNPTNLPGEVTPLVDRATERQRLTALIESSRLVTVTGPGGIGKSRLAIRVARDLIEHTPDGAFYVDAATMDSVDMLADELIRVLGGRLLPGATATESLLDQLRDRSVLVLIDTVDRVRDVGRFLSRIAATCSVVRILVTSRTALHVGGERELPVEPLAVVRRGSVDAIASSPAVELFVARARALRSDFVLSTSNAAAVAEICARLDGLPLAIELAAARIRVLSPEALVARLARRLPLLTGGAADAPDRQRTLHATIDWSYQQLAPDEQRAFARLAVFAGAFDLEAAEGVLAAGGRDGLADAPDVLDVVQRLVDQSLLVASPFETEPRFQFLATIREFAREALEASGAADDTRRAHAAYFDVLAKRWAPKLQGPDDLLAVEQLAASIDELRATLEWLLGAASGGPAGLELAGELGRFWYVRGDLREGGIWLERALAAAESAGAPRARALYWLGVLRDEARRPADAVGPLEEALRLMRELGDEVGIARTLNSLGAVARDMGDLDRAEALFAESLERKRHLGDQRGSAATLSNLGLVAVDRGRLEEARDRFSEALALDRASGEHGAQAYSLVNLGAAQIWLGAVGAGAAAVREALTVFVELEDSDGIAESIEHLGEAALAFGNPGTAARLILAARVLRERAGAPPREVEAARIEAALASAQAALSPSERGVIAAEAASLDEKSAVDLALEIHQGS